jgi:hypothetical protein
MTEPTITDIMEVLQTLTADIQRLRQQAPRLDQLTGQITQLQSQVQGIHQTESSTHRQQVIRNSRESLILQSTQLQSSPLASPPPVPHMSGRLTRSPATPYTPTSVAENKDETGAEDFAQPTVTSLSSFTPGRRQQLVQLMKSIKAPPTFCGDRRADSIPDVRDWAERWDAYFDMHLGAEDHSGTLNVVRAQLNGTAAKWLQKKLDELAKLQKSGSLDASPIEWDELKNEFIEAFEGTEYRILKKIELEKLRLGRGDCRTVMDLNTRFDDLARRLYKSGTDLSTVDLYLADLYSDVIRRSDLDLWIRAQAVTIPKTLEGWKKATADAWGTREGVKRQLELIGKSDTLLRSERPWRHGSGFDNHKSAAQVNELAAEDGEGVIREGQEGEEDRQSGTLANIRTGGRATISPVLHQERRGVKLTEGEVAKLRAANRCLDCYKPNHRWNKCRQAKDQLPNRRPNEEELKALKA